MDSSDNSNDCQGDNDHTSVSEPVSQMLTPEPAPLDVPHPSTPPAQGPVLCSASSGGSSEITTLSLSSPPLTPPPRVMRRLTPLDRFSPRKRANSIDDDLETHASRRLLLLDQRTARSAAHTDAVCKKLSSLQQQKLRKRELLLEKLSKAVKNRQDYVNRKRLIASSTVRHICSAGSSDDARSMEMCVSHEQGPCCYSFADSFKSVAGLSVWENLRRVHQQPRDRAADVVAVCGNRRFGRAGGAVSFGTVFPVWLCYSGRKGQARAVQSCADVRGAAERDTAVFRPAGQGLPEPEAAPPRRQLLRVSCG
ncbi:hypothetical protein KL909_001589 [Ogataea angusta]|nr:hypothetical protein KL909_001589 [Ogataea angusta]